MAKYTGTTIHARLAALEAYKAGEYEKALKTLYLKTDEDLRAGTWGCGMAGGVPADRAHEQTRHSSLIRPAARP